MAYRRKGERRGAKCIFKEVRAALSPVKGPSARRKGRHSKVHLQRIRRPAAADSPLWKKWGISGLFFFAGLATSAAIKFPDVYTSRLSNLFSQMSVWIFLGTLIAIYSRTPGWAAAHVFCGCVGMLITYYLTARLIGGVYSKTFMGAGRFSRYSAFFSVFT